MGRATHAREARRKESGVRSNTAAREANATLLTPDSALIKMGKAEFKESAYVADMTVSSTLAVVVAAERLRAQGVEVIDLGAGPADFPTPGNVKQAGHRAVDPHFKRFT